MRIFLITLAVLGLLFIAIGTTMSFSSSGTLVNTGELGSGVGYFLAISMGIFGTILSLIGGLISRPKYLWIGLIIIGIVYIASFYGYFAPSSGGYPNNLSPNKIIVILVLILLPGLVCLGEGIFLLKYNKRVKNRLS